MNLWLLKPRHKIRTRDGAEAEVLAETQDGAWVKVRYLEVPDDPSLIGTEDLLDEEEVEVLLGVVAPTAWGDEVRVIVHYRPEDEDYGGGYEATTMMGVPHSVVVNGYDEDSAEGALDNLLLGLQAFGFRGRVLVEDATELGHPRQYEIEVPR